MFVRWAVSKLVQVGVRVVLVRVCVCVFAVVYV